MPRITKIERAEGPDARCPYCNKVLNAATHLDDGVPSPNDFSICVGCANMLRYDDELRLRKFSKAEWDALTADEQSEIRAIRALVQAHRAK